MKVVFRGEDSRAERKREEEEEEFWNGWRAQQTGGRSEAAGRYAFKYKAMEWQDTLDCAHPHATVNAALTGMAWPGMGARHSRETK